MKKIIAILILTVCFYNTQAQEFDVQQLPKAKKFDWSGSVGGSVSVYNTTAAENRSNPFSWNLNGNFSAKILDVLDLPFTFSINQFQSTYTKPELQFGISPRYKWATFHLGHRNLTFNPYTLNGHTFLGAGVELTPKKWRIAAMYGRLKPAIDVDTTTGAVVQPSFKRIGYGAKLGYGNESNFIDIMYFYAKDDSNSIKNWKDEEIQKKMGDAYALKAAQNHVFGLSTKITFLKKWSFFVDAGASILNKDLGDTSVDKDNIDRTWAGKGGVGYAGTNFSIKVEYERVSPNYTSLGSYFFNNDLENITISPSGALAKGKVLFATSFGIQRDNLDNTKEQTSKRFVANANINVNPKTYWGFDVSYNNFGMRTVSGTEPIKDSVRIRQVNQTLVVSPHYSFIDSSANTTLGLALSYNDVNDKNIVTKEYGNMKAMAININHSTTFNKRGNAINSGLNYNNVKTAQLKNTQYGFTVGYSHPFFENTLTTSVSCNYNFSKVNGEQDGNIINGTATAAYNYKKHSFSFNFNIINTTSKQFAGYTETLATLGYNYRLK